MKHTILCVLAALVAFSQVQTPLTIYQSSGSSRGELRMQERRTNGTDYVGLKAPESVPSSIVWSLPSADGTSGQCLQTDGAGAWQWGTCSVIDLVTTDYDWSRTPGGSLTGGVSATATLTPCPDGVAPYSTHHNVRISGGTGTAETVLIEGVAGSGASCSIDFTPANDHSGAWAIGSASAGIHEAARMVANGNTGRLYIPTGAQAMDQPAPGEETTVYIQSGIAIAGGGNDPGTGSYLSVAGDQWAMIIDTVYPVELRNFGISGTGAMSAGGGIKLTAPTTNHNCWSMFDNLQISAVPVSMHLQKACAPQVRNSFFSSYGTYGLLMENTSYPDAGDQSIANNQFLVVGSGGIGTTAIRWESAGGAKIIGNKFNTQGAAIDLASSTNTIIAIIDSNSFDNQTEFSVKLRAASPDSFAFVGIHNNVFTGAGASGYEAIDVGDTTDDIDAVSITGNVMQTAGTAIRIGSADKVTIDGNTIGLYTTGIKTTSAATQVALGQNTMYSVTTAYDIASDSTVRPMSPLFASGYARQWASATNVQSIAEFAEPSVGASSNNAIMFLNGSTGANSQRGIWWGYNTGDLNFSRFGTAKTAAPTTDFKLETDGDAVFSYNVGIGSTPTAGIALDVRGVARVFDGTIDLRTQVGGGAAYIGATSNHPVLLMQDATERLRIGNSALLPGTADAYNAGDPTKRFLGTYSKIFDSVAAGGTGDYMQTRKLQLFDNTGSTTGASFWDLNVVMSGAGAFQNSYFYLRDNGGNTVWRADKIASGAAVATTTIYTDLLPDSTANARDLGKTTQRWDEINGASLDLTGAANITGNLSAAVINATGSPAYRVSGTTVINASRAATFTDLTINTSAAPAVGDVWTATSTGGAGSWQTPTSSAPFIDSTAIIKGSADASKLLKIEVDGFTTGTTRTLTPQNNSYTIAGIDIAQTFTQTQTLNGTVAMVINGTITGDLLFSSSNTYIVGNSTNYLNAVHANNVIAYASFLPASGVTTVDVGSSTRRVRKMFTADLDITGTVTPPSGTAFSGTKTVRDSAGTGTCTLTFSSGIMTGGTC